jgi:LAO/AO transport system kinase
MQSLGGRHSEAGAWRPPIVKTVAARGEGIDEVLAALDKHAEWLERSGEGERRRRARAAGEVEAIAVAALRERIGDLHGSAALDALAGRVLSGGLDPYAAADELVATLTA